MDEIDTEWQPDLDIVSRSYLSGAYNDTYAFQYFLRRKKVDDIPLAVAEQIASKPYNFPDYLVALAEAKCRQVALDKVVPVAQAAKNGKWFD